MGDNRQPYQVKGKITRSGTADQPPTGSPRATWILTNPPFNQDFLGQDDDPRWRYGPPPKGNANFAWLQHVVNQLEPGGRACVLMPNGAASSTNKRERQIREGMVTDGCVEALISLPPSLFRGTGVPVTLWLLEPPGTQRDAILFVDASGAGCMTSRTLRELDGPEISTITRLVTEWRNGQPLTISRTINAVPATLEEIRERDYNLNPPLYMPAAVPTTESPEEIGRLLGSLENLQAAAREKDAEAMRTLRDLLQ